MPNTKASEIQKGLVSIIPRHTNREAYCLMTYQSDDKKINKLIWNSRDGVTPFIIGWPTDDYDVKVDLVHSNWRKDVYCPLYVPPVKSKIFVDATPQLVTPDVIKYVNRNWGSGEWPLKKFNDTKEQAIKLLVDEWSCNRDPAGRFPPEPQPWLLTVTPEIHQKFKERAEWKL